MGQQRAAASWWLVTLVKLVAETVQQGSARPTCHLSNATPLRRHHATQVRRKMAALEGALGMPPDLQ